MSFESLLYSFAKSLYLCKLYSLNKDIVPEQAKWSLLSFHSLEYLKARNNMENKDSFFKKVSMTFQNFSDLFHI